MTTKKNLLYAVCMTVILAAACGSGAFGLGLIGLGVYHTMQSAPSDTVATTPRTPHCHDLAPHCMAVRSARANVQPFEPAILPYVTDAYNKNVVTHLHWAKRCVSQKADFVQMERKTLYPMAMIMGIASHESMGCRTVNATNGDGGTGVMQVTYAAPEYKKRAAAMLGISLGQLDIRHVVTHNVAVGLVIWDDCERKTGRRDLAALCYNRGIGATNAVARWARPKGTKAYPSYTLMHPYINGKVYHTLGPIARKYTGEVVAHMVMVNMLMQGVEPKKLPKGQLLKLDDIPGWNPSHDGDAFVVGLGSAPEE